MEQKTHSIHHMKSDCISLSARRDKLTRKYRKDILLTHKSFASAEKYQRASKFFSYCYRISTYCISSVILALRTLAYLGDIMCRWVKDWPISALREFPVICVKTPENVACAMYFFVVEVAGCGGV